MRNSASTRTYYKETEQAGLGALLEKSPGKVENIVVGEGGVASRNHDCRARHRHDPKFDPTLP
jgi:hypothetical protein